MAHDTMTFSRRLGALVLGKNCLLTYIVGAITFHKIEGPDYTDGLMQPHVHLGLTDTISSGGILHPRPVSPVEAAFAYTAS